MKWNLATGLAALLTLTTCGPIEDPRTFVDTQAVATEQETSAEVIGYSLGSKARGEDSQALATVRAIMPGIPPATVRPDPDLYARLVLQRFRPNGATLARVLGSLQEYRLLLGGANDDFTRVPQSSFDATSLLAALTISRIVCRSLVNPNQEFDDWQSILPQPPEEVSGNLRFLASRLLGVPAATVADSKIAELQALLASDGTITREHYIVPCTALLIDAEANLL